MAWVDIADAEAGSSVRTKLNTLGALVDLKSPLASPTFTGTPAAPTAAGGTNTTQLATTAFVAAGFQPLDADLTTIAGLAATTDNFIVSVASAWASRTPAQVRTTLTLAKNNFAASAAPAVTDDTASGYSAGSIWMWAATGRMWRCRDATASAAAWTELDVSDHPGYISANWLLPPGLTAIAGAAPTTGRMLFVPFFIKSRVTLSSLGVRVTTAASGGNLQLAIYANNPATGRPTGNALATTASISTTSTGNVSAAIAGGNVTFEPGMFWAAYNTDATAGGTVVIQVPSLAACPISWLVGTATQANIGASATNAAVLIHVVQAYNTWPDVTAATFVESTTSSNNGPLLQFKVA